MIISWLKQEILCALSKASALERTDDINHILAQNTWICLNHLTMVYLWWLIKFQNYHILISVDYQGYSALMCACDSGEIPVVQNILDYGTSVNARSHVSQKLHARISFEHCSKTGFTPLIISSRKGNLTISEILICAGANIECRDKVGFSYFQYLWNEYNEYNILRDGQNDATPLMLAADCGHSDVINLLLDHGAAIEAEDNVRLDAFCLVKHYFHQCRSPSNIVSSGSPRLCIPVE